MTRRITCVVFDLDFTLTHFKHPVKVMFRLLRKFAIPESLAKACYARVRDNGGYAPERFLNELTMSGVALMSRDVLRERLDRWFYGSFEPYPDSALAIDALHQRHIPVCVLTAGDEEFQRRKREVAHLPFEQVIVVPHVGEKAGPLRGIIARYGAPILFVDDKESELDAVRDAGLTEAEVITVHICRPDSPYWEQKPKHRHIEIAILTDLGGIVAGSGLMPRTATC